MRFLTHCYCSSHLLLFIDSLENLSNMTSKVLALPLVSVVMPSLNQVQFLEIAVRSVLEHPSSTPNDASC